MSGRTVAFGLALIDLGLALSLAVPGLSAAHL
jgi:hypothetical protein